MVNFEFRKALIALCLLALVVSSPVKADGIIENPQSLYGALDGYAPALKISRLEGRILDFSRGGYPISSVEIKEIRESWYSGRTPNPVPDGWVGRFVEIRRWEFQNEQDPLVWPRIGGKAWGSAVFPGWNQGNGPLVGENSCWSQTGRFMLFTKGRFLVGVYVNSKQVGNVDYTLKVAKELESKLP